jgi:hypothetical protein
VGGSGPGLVHRPAGAGIGRGAEHGRWPVATSLRSSRLASKNNMDYGSDEIPAFIDFGGALGARAHGQFKSDDIFSEAVGSFENNLIGREIYNSFDLSKTPNLPSNHPWNRITQEDVKEVLSLFESLSDQKIKWIVENAKYSNRKDEAYMISALRQRRDAMIEFLKTEQSKFIEPVKAETPEHLNSPAIPHYASSVLKDKIIAVHATNSFPINGILKAGSHARVDNYVFEEESNAQKDFRHDVRFTVHFNLGELVRPHTPSAEKDNPWQMNWEKRKFAILTRLNNLIPQMMNINPNDTFVIGDYEIPAGPVILVPEGELVNLPKGIKVRYYDPKSISLRDAIDSEIEALGGWKINGKDGTGLGPNYLNGVDINNPQFFEPLLNELPYISFGIHADSSPGILADGYNLSSALDRAVNNYTLFTNSGAFSNLNLKLKIYQIKSLMKQIEADMKKRKAPDILQLKMKIEFADMEKWVNLLEADLKLREKTGKTIQGYDPDQYASLRNDPQALQDKMLSLARSQKWLLLSKLKASVKIGKIHSEADYLLSIIKSMDEKTMKSIFLFDSAETENKFRKAIGLNRSYFFLLNIIPLLDSGAIQVHTPN